MRLGILISLLVHGSAAVALALLGTPVLHTEPRLPITISVRADEPPPTEIESLPEALLEEHEVLERWEFPEEDVAAPEEIEVPQPLGARGDDLPRPVRLAKPLRRPVPARIVAVVPRKPRAPAPRRAPGKLEPPRLLADSSPSVLYPESARRLGIEGVVILLLHIDARGAVVDTAVLATSGHETLDRAAADAAALWRFEPARRDGEPITFEVRVPVEFRLTDA